MYVFGLEVGLRLVIISRYGLGFVHKPTFTLTKNLTPAATVVLSICRGSISFQIGGGDQEVNIIAMYIDNEGRM